MLKLTFLMKRKSGLSFAEFRDYYENHHAPMAAALCPNLVRYTRTYVTECIALSRRAPSSNVDFDCITECWYDVEGGWEERSKDLLPPDIFRQMAGDEENFLDRAATKLLITEQEESPAKSLAGNHV